MTKASHPASLPWWRGASIYQVYPRSYQDSDADGVGDLGGIARRMGHLASLGVDAVWISPFFASPMRDFGYDVSDYCAVDPMFGTLADFDALVAAAHERGVRIIIDQVYSHTSDRHAWFGESRASRGNPRSDWYVWADPKPDGSPPNNWQSVFGGPAWTWDARRQQYYLHNFLREQPQLNLHNPAVQSALLDVARFWLNRGVDGFRIDALNFAMFDPRLPDNPPAPEDGRPRTRPFDFQIRLYNQFHPGTVGFVERLRALADRYGETFLLGEIGGDEGNVEMQRLTAGATRLHSAYGFDFLYASDLSPRLVADTMALWPDKPGTGWPSWAFENHDAPRAVSRWSSPANSEAFARVKMALLLTMRGNPILYQGEELGLVQDDIPFEQLRDPEAIANWPLTLSRDGARTPMPWEDSPFGGFSSVEPWLPMSEANRRRCVASQSGRKGSMLEWTRELLALRKAWPALRHGGIEMLEIGKSALAFRRTLPGESLVCRFSFGGRPSGMTSPDEHDYLFSFEAPASGAGIFRASCHRE